LICNVRDACHPEDWTLDGGKWQHVGTFDRKRLSELEENPHNLWLEDRQDRAPCNPQFCKKRQQSLYLVRPKNLRVRLWKEHDKWKGYVTKKTRAMFNYGGLEYDLGLTDDFTKERYCRTFPDVDEPASEVRLPFGDECLLCVSLTPKFNGYHYKVVAAMLKLQRRFSLIPKILRRNT